MLKFNDILKKIELLQLRNMKEIEWDVSKDIVGNNIFNTFKIQESNGGFRIFAQSKNDDIFYGICFIDGSILNKLKE